VQSKKVEMSFVQDPYYSSLIINTNSQHPRTARMVTLLFRRSSLTHCTYCKFSQNLCAAQADFPTLRTYRAQLIRRVCLTQHFHQCRTLYLDRPRDINNFATLISIKNQPINIQSTAWNMTHTTLSLHFQVDLG